MSKFSPRNYCGMEHCDTQKEVTLRGNVPMSISTRDTSLSASRPLILLIDLPEDVIELIASRLDRRSFYNLASSHPRLRVKCRNSAHLQQIKGAAEEDILTKLVSLNPLGIRHLDLSNCWVDSRRLKSLIKKCHNVTKLNLVNSSLKLAPIRDVLGTLEKLEDFSLTIAQQSPSKIMFGCYPRIRRIYVEFPPSYRLMEFVGKFLESFTGVAYLHLNIIGAAAQDRPGSTDGSLLSAERLKCYRTIILATKMQERFRHQMVISRLFGADAFVHRSLLQSASLEGMFWFERENVNEEEPTRREPVKGSLSHRYQELDLTRHDLLALPDVYGTGQLGLRIHFSYREGYHLMPDMSPLSSLVELDLTSCHLIFPTESWWSLAYSSPAVKALALSLCSLCTSLTDYYRYLINESILVALKSLDLRKLHVQATHDAGCRACRFCRLSSVLMKHISDFHNLHELILNDVCSYEEFLVPVSRPFAMKTVKFNLKWIGRTSLNGLAEFLGLCKNLRHLKLGSFDLPIGTPQLWDALCQANLKQLCLSSFSSEELETGMLAPRIARLFRNLDIFHLHASLVSNATEVFSFFKDEVRRVNLSRGDKPMHFIMTGPNFGDNAYIKIPCYPGRNLCFTKGFIGTVPPDGWDNE